MQSEPIQVTHFIHKLLAVRVIGNSLEIFSSDGRVQLDCHDHASAEKLRDSFIDTVSDIWIAVRG